MRPDDPRADRVVAAVDVGSNSIKMTVGRAASGGIEELAVASETVRLGAGMERLGRLADDRVEAALVVLARYAAQARALDAERLIGVATEATRFAANGPEFLARAQRESGWELRVVSGDEEAGLTFRGLAATTDVSGELVVADIGGGSTEVIVASGGVPRGARSLPLGSGRLTDRFLTTDPPTADQIAACRSEARSVLTGLEGQGVRVPRGAGIRLLTVGGTGEYLGRLVGRPAFAPSEIGAVVDILRSTPAAVLAERLVIQEARARVLPAGVATVWALADLIEPSTIEIARSGIRTGLLMAEFAGERGASSDG